MNKLCKICSENNHKYYCNIIGNNICESCCTNYQLNRLTSKWNNFIVNNEIDDTYKKCLSCEGLTRTSGQKLYLKKSFSVYTFFYKGKFIFSNDINECNEKKIEYLKRIGCSDYYDYFYLGEAYFDLSKTKEAIDAFKKAESLSNKSSKDLYFYLAKSFYRNNNFNNAKSYLLKSIKIDDKFSQGYRLLADIHREEENYNESINYYKKSLENIGISKDGFFNQNYFGLAISYSKLGLHKKVIKTSKRFLNYFGQWEQNKELLLKHKRGEIYHTNGEFNIFVLTNIFRLMCLSYLELNEIKSAEKYIERAKILNENDSDIIKIDGIIIGRKHNQKEIQEYKNTINELKNNIENNLLIKEMHSSIKKIEKEVTQNNILELKPNFCGIGLNLNNLIQKIDK